MVELMHMISTHDTGDIITDGDNGNCHRGDPTNDVGDSCLVTMMTMTMVTMTLFLQGTLRKQNICSVLETIN